MSEPSPSVLTVERYMEGFRRTDRAMILSCLTDDIEWLLPGVFHVRGKDEFAKHIVDEGFEGSPVIGLSRVLEVADVVVGSRVVVAEGSVLATRSNGSKIDLAFCDLFEMRGARIWRLTSYLMQLGERRPAT